MDTLKIGEYAKILEGKHTLYTIIKKLNLKANTVKNILVKLKKEGYLKREGGGKQKRIYTISNKKEFLEKENGMFSILNKHLRTKIIPPYKHIVYGNYGVEEAIPDILDLKDFRCTLGVLKLFNNVKNWNKLREYAKRKKIEPVIGALYDLARKTLKTKRMPQNIREHMLKDKTKTRIILFKNLRTNLEEVKNIENTWNVQLPFSKEDLEEIK